MYRIILCFALLLSLQCNLEAQLWKTIKKSVEHHTEDRAEKEADKAIEKGVNDAIDEALDGAEDSDSDGTSSDQDTAPRAGTDDEHEQQQANDWVTKMLGGSDVELPESYALDFRIDYDVQDDKGKESKLSYLLGSDNHWGVITDDGKNNAMMIIDEERDVIVMYTEEKGKKKAQKLPSMMNSQFVADAVDSNDDLSYDFSLKQTGRTKDILGYSCDEFHITSDEGSGYVWTTDAIDADFMSMFTRSMSKSKKMKKMAEAMKQLKGTTLESHYTDKKGKETHMIATAVDNAPPAINNNEYEITGLGQ